MFWNDWEVRTSWVTRLLVGIIIWYKVYKDVKAKKKYIGKYLTTSMVIKFSPFYLSHVQCIDDNWQLGQVGSCGDQKWTGQISVGILKYPTRTGFWLHPHDDLPLCGSLDKEIVQPCYTATKKKKHRKKKRTSNSKHFMQFPGLNI